MNDERRPKAAPESASPTTTAIVSGAPVVVRYLRSLIGRHPGETPLIADLTSEQLGTTAGTSSIARAALAWLADGTDEAIRERLVDELATADLLCRWRIRMAGLDVRGDTDWVRVFEVTSARRDYRERWGVPA